MTMGDSDSAEAKAAAARALVDCVRRLYARGWCDGTGGNYSLTLERKPLRLLLTRSGVDKGRITPEDLMVVGPGGRPVAGEQGRPSAESPLHAVIVERTGASAVLHTHSVWGTLLGECFLDRGELRLRGYEMLKGIEGVASHEDEVVVPVIANSQEMDVLSGEIEGLTERHPALRGFLIAGHGMYTWGASLAEAHRHVEIFEFLFRLVGRRARLEPFE
jgi:methylthioribulose-1-phosphate dehydratase